MTALAQPFEQPALATVRVESDASAWRRLELVDEPAMGGRLRIIATLPAARSEAAADEATAEEAAARRCARAARRLLTWAGRLTRFDPASELSRLNSTPETVATVGPTLAAVLRWAADANERSQGIVDATLLDERLACESAEIASPTGLEPRGWRLERRGRTTLVQRHGRFRFDLDGIAKGWLADRTLALLADLPGAIVDADGDIAIAVAPGDRVDIGVMDPFRPGQLVAVLAGPPVRTAHRRTLGIATSGTTIHAWPAAPGRPARNHLIDPRTRTSTAGDLVQATVVAASARLAESLAKTAVILGLDDGARFLEHAGAAAAVLVTDQGRCVATLGSQPWLAGS